MTYPPIAELMRLERVARKVAARDTAYEPLEHLWSPEHPLMEHCGAIAHTVQSLWGGVILSGRDSGGVRWLWNRLPDGREVSVGHEGAIGVKGRVFRPRCVNKRFALFAQRVRDAWESVP